MDISVFVLYRHYSYTWFWYYMKWTSANVKTLNWIKKKLYTLVFNDEDSGLGHVDLNDHLMPCCIQKAAMKLIVAIVSVLEIGLNSNHLRMFVLCFIFWF